MLIGSGIGALYRLAFETGDVIWKFNTFLPYPMNSGPAIGDQYPDIVVVRSYDQNVYGVNFTSGEMLWRVNTNGGGGSSATIVGEMAYIGSWDRNLYAIKVNKGEVVWKFNTQGEVIQL